jgi:hypothetical protein
MKIKVTKGPNYEKTIDKAYRYLCKVLVNK